MVVASGGVESRRDAMPAWLSRPSADPGVFGLVGVVLAVAISVLVTVPVSAQGGGDCYAGLVVEAGESCTYPGTDVEFSVDGSGSGRLLFLSSGQRSELRATSVNGVEYTFVASKQSGGGWLIEEVGPATSTDPATTPPTPEAGFSDLDGAGTHRSAVESLAGEGIFEGTECRPGGFCPDGAVQRWVMAVWLVRILDGADPGPVSSSQFADVDAEVWWAPYVERLADLGVTTGCSTEPVRYCPHETVTRARMASFLVRAFGLPPASPAGFVDVSGGVHAANIDALAVSGITRGCRTEPLRYCPGRDTTRAQMATFLVRALRADAAPPTSDARVFRLGDTIAGFPAGSDVASGTFSDTSVTISGGGTSLLTMSNRGTAEYSKATYTCTSADGCRIENGRVTKGTVTATTTEPPITTTTPEPPITTGVSSPATAAVFTAISTGGNHSCAIRTSGTLECWGEDRNGQATPPGGNYTAISAGGDHSCAIRTSGTLECWGENRDGQASAPGGNYTAISAGGDHSCAIHTNGTLECWGENRDGQASAPGGNYTAISAGGDHSCAIHTNGTLECWGASYGLEDATTTPLKHSCSLGSDGTAQCGGTSRRLVPPFGTFKSVWTSAAGTRSCGQRPSGNIECWTFDETTYSFEPVDTPDGAFSSVSAASSHACGLRSDGTIECWGTDQLGRLDAPTGTFTAVSTGDRHSCGVRTDGTIECWGNSSFGATTPPSGPFTAISAGYDHTCGLRTDGTIECWGSNRNGQATPPSGPLTAISAGRDHMCALRTNRTVTCVGDNSKGQSAGRGGEFTHISAGGNHSCGLRTDGTIECWGDNGNVNAPKGRFTSVSAGGTYSTYTCGVRTDGSLTCWSEGYNFDGWLDTPDGTFTTVSAGGGHACGVRSDGSLACWGNNDHGQATAPKGSFKSVSAARFHTCGLRTDSTVECWGYGGTEQLRAPKTAFIAVAAGGESAAGSSLQYGHACGLRPDGTVECWGNNDHGQATAPDGRFTAISAGGENSCGIRTDGTVECWGSSSYYQNI